MAKKNTTKKHQHCKDSQNTEFKQTDWSQSHTQDVKHKSCKKHKSSKTATELGLLQVFSNTKHVQDKSQVCLFDFKVWCAPIKTYNSKHL